MFRQYFKDTYGIDLIAEGKLVSTIILPAVSNQITLDPLLQYVGAYEVNTPVKGIALSAQQYRSLIYYLNQQFLADQTVQDKSDAEFTKYKKNYFSHVGVKAETAIEEKKLPNIHFIFSNEQKKKAFMHKFAQYNPKEGYDLINQKPSVEMPPGFLNQLMEEYYANALAENGTIQYQRLQDQLANLIKLKAWMNYQSVGDLNRAHRLSLDYNNSNDVNLRQNEASKAYALSLAIFAEVNRDVLSDFQYDYLKHASNMLASYDEHGQLQQSLQTDANFTTQVVGLYTTAVAYKASPGLNGYPIISALSDEQTKKKIIDALDQNTTAILYGGNGMKAFLPNAKMQSETDEMVFQGGGMIGHSAMFRMIKVGVTADGTPIPYSNNLSQKPHHYEYYKVESNLGAGCRHPYYPLCIGTYITKLEPFAFDKQTNQYIPTKTNPYTHPELYQQEMEITLRGLISAERQLLFYRQPTIGQNGELSSTPGSPEAQEWERLNSIRQQLSGTRCEYVTYLAKDSSGHAKLFMVNEQLGYMQEQASCPIFSIKQLVNGVINGDLNTIHSGFLQANDGEGHFAQIDKKIQTLEKLLQPVKIQINATYTQLWIDAFKRYANVVGQPKGLMVVYSPLSFSTSMNTIVISDPQLKQAWHSLCMQQTCEFTIDAKVFPSLIREFEKQYFSSGVPGMKISPTSPTETTVSFSDPLIAMLWEQHYKANSVTLSAKNLFSQKQNQQSGLQILQTLNLTAIQHVESAMIAEDTNKPDSFVIKLQCNGAFSALLLAQSIEKHTTNNPKVTITNTNEVIVDEERSKALFQKLNVDGKKILPNLPLDPSAQTKNFKF